MREKRTQLPLTRSGIEHPHAAELEKISEILDANPRWARLVAQDLVRGVKDSGTGRRGLSGEQVLRILLLKQQWTGFSYEELGFHLADSVTYRRFCRFGAFDATPARATLAENLKKVRQRTLHKVHGRLVRYAVELGVEKGQRVRVDATVTESNIHAPTDSWLLWDGVRVLVRLLGRARALTGFDQWSDHTKRAKRRLRAVEHTGNGGRRKAAYQDLLKVAGKSVRYGEAAVERLGRVHGERRSAALALLDELHEKLVLVCAVIDQTQRRVLRGESVPAEEKIVSLFEDHTDIIIKDRREVLYGHKVFLAGGESGLITECVIASGNPADTSMVKPMLRSHTRIVGKLPEQACFDGGFASKANLAAAKALGVKDVAFSKKRGLAVSDMVRSSWIYRRLRNFRAGIEGVISFLKRAFGLDRCTWRGRESFGSYVTASVIAANALTLARHLLG